MSDEITALRERIERLQSELSEARAELKRRLADRPKAVPVYGRTPPLTDADLDRARFGKYERARRSVLASQPRKWSQAIRLLGVGRSLANQLARSGLVEDDRRECGEPVYGFTSPETACPRESRSHTGP